MLHRPVRQLTLRAGVRACQRLSRHFSSQSNHLVSSVSTPTPTPTLNTREELHRLALLENQKHHQLERAHFEAETDIAMTKIPRDIRFDHRDSVELRDWKRRQQYYYNTEQQYGFLNDSLVKLGLLPKQELDERREWIKQRLKSQKWISDESRRTSVSLRALALVQREYGVPSELLIEKQDTLEQKQEKVKQQIQFWVKQTEESLDKLPSDGKAVREEIKKAKQSNRMNFKNTPQEDIELFLLEHEEELKTELDWDDAKFMAYAIRARKMAAQIAQETTADSLVKTGPLDKLQLIEPHTLEKVELALKNASVLMTKRADEFELRFGGLPLELENDPYIIEAQEQLKFLKSRRAAAPQQIAAGGATASEGQQTKAAETADAAPQAEKPGAGDEIVVEGEVKDEVSTDPNAVYEEDLYFRSESDAEDPDLSLYTANRKPLVFLSSPEEDGEQWPRIVDGVDLSDPKIQKIRDFDYDAFEEAPSPLEVRIMDAFAVQRQLRHAKQHNITLVPRVHIPNSPADRSLIAKTLLIYRLTAIRNYIKRLREEAKRQYDREYRDISKLNLKVPFDPVNPWKQDLFDQVELVLKNQGNWTTGQKEDCMIKLHRMLTDETFSKENQDKAQL